MTFHNNCDIIINELVHIWAGMIMFGTGNIALFLISLQANKNAVQLNINLQQWNLERACYVF